MHNKSLMWMLSPLTPSLPWRPSVRPCAPSWPLWPGWCAGSAQGPSGWPPGWVVGLAGDHRLAGIHSHRRYRWRWWQSPLVRCTSMNPVQLFPVMAVQHRQSHLSGIHSPLLRYHCQFRSSTGSCRQLAVRWLIVGLEWLRFRLGSGDGLRQRPTARQPQTLRASWSLNCTLWWSTQNRK